MIEFRPSAAYRWLRCPASAVKAEETSSPYAEEGILAHALLEDRLRRLGRVNLGDEWRGHTVTPAMEEHVEEAADYIEGFRGAMLVETEVALWVPLPGGAFEPITGTADVVTVGDDGRLHVFDLKYGRGHRVAAEGNPQLRLYGYGAAMGVADLLDHHTDEISLHICQPRLAHYEHWDTSLEDTVTWLMEVVAPAIAEARSPRPGYEPSEEACRWCPHRQGCPGLFEEAVRQFDGAELETLLERAPLMELAIKAARETALNKLMQGEPVAGWKLVEGRRSRDWGKDAVEMLERQGLDPWERRLRSPHSMEKEHGELGVPIAVKPGKPTLVREDDPRAPYQAATAAEFDQESPE